MNRARHGHEHQRSKALRESAEVGHTEVAQKRVLDFGLRSFLKCARVDLEYGEIAIRSRRADGLIQPLQQVRRQHMRLKVAVLVFDARDLVCATGERTEPDW